jgi:hypothetical protein
VKYGTRVLPGPDTPIGRELRDWRLGLMADLGGLEALSTQQLALVDQAVVQRYLVASLDAYVLSLPALVNKRSRCLFPIVRERTAQVNLLRDLLRDLGLERKAKPVPDLAEYLAAVARGGNADTEKPQADTGSETPGISAEPTKQESAEMRERKGLEEEG